MNAKTWNEVKDLLNKALEIEPDRRRDFLEQAGVSPDIRSEVESLLAGENEAEGLMDTPAIAFAQSFLGDEEADNALIGQSIGAYKIVSELGYGGMGAVYLAERADGKFSQRVALKLLKRELNTTSLRNRFEQERRILASLEHPNIARLLDAGATDDGVPYFAMEYIEGLPIDVYCRQNDLTLDERLDLFREVCSAVNFAHRNLIVHRDLKPSNILVNQDRTPKLLDFGISKIISDEFQQTATLTKFGAMTPSYASPEQLQNRGTSTATDIYSLGVVLYELLSGHRPFEKQEHDLKQIYQAVIESDPPAPSSLTGTHSGVLQFRSAVEIEHDKNDTADIVPAETTPHAAISAQYLRGDLDNIVLKALKKEPERRYTSAENLAEDIKRHQKGLTVTARPDVFSYRAAKFIRRNRLAVGSAVVIVLVVFAGLIATLWQARVAAAERDRARQQAQKAEKISGYMRNILNFSNPHWLSSNPERNRNATVSQAMEEALKNIDTELPDEPEIKAEILFAICTSYTQQAKYEEAENVARAAISNFDQALGEGNLRSMQVSVVLGDILTYRAKYEDAGQQYTKAIDYFRPLIARDNSQVKWLVIALNQLGNVYILTGKIAAAEPVIRESNDYAVYVTGKDRVVVPVVMANLGNSLVQSGKFEEGIKFLDRSYEEMKAVGTDKKVEAGQMLMAKGKAHTFLNDFELADTELQESYRILVGNFGEESYFSSLVMYSIANNYYQWGKYPESRTMIEKALNAAHKIYPKGHASIGVYTRVSGELYTKTGDLKHGESELRFAVEDLSQYLKEPNQEIALVKESLGANLIAQKRFDEARLFLISALDNYVKTRGDNHPFTKRCRERLSSV